MKRIFIKIISRFFLFPAWFMPMSSLRRFFHILRGVKIGKGTYIGYFVIIDHNYPDNILIGEGGCIASRCFITSHDESYFFSLGKKQKMAKVKIGNNVMIGTGCVVLPGIIIGEKSIIGANSVVNKNIPANYLAAGSPAKPIKKLK